jgi:hypothetical protein
MKKKTRSHSEIVRDVLIVTKNRKIAEPIRKAIDTVFKYIDEPLILKSLERVESPFSSTQKRVRVKLAYILISFLSYSDFASLRIGVANSNFLSPVMHRSILRRAERLSNERIPRSTYFRLIKKLINAKYLHSEAMNIAEQDENNKKVIRGRAGYKWFGALFFKDLNFSESYMKEQREFALRSLRNSKLSNIFPTWHSKTARCASLRRNKLEAYTTVSKEGEFDTNSQLNLYH